MSIDEIASEALKLPVLERAALASSLWESIEDPFDLTVARSDEEALALALGRDADLESGAVPAVPHAEMMQRLRG